MNEHGARVYPPNGRRVLIKQTTKSETSSNYVIDRDINGKHKERFVDLSDNKEIADAIRDALRGKLTSRG